MLHKLEVLTAMPRGGTQMDGSSSHLSRAQYRRPLGPVPLQGKGDPRPNGAITARMCVCEEVGSRGPLGAGRTLSGQGRGVKPGLGQMTVNTRAQTKCLQLRHADLTETKTGSACPEFL